MACGYARQEMNRRSYVGKLPAQSISGERGASTSIERYRMKDIEQVEECAWPWRAIVPS